MNFSGIDILATYPTTATIGATNLYPSNIFSPPNPQIKCNIKQPAGGLQLIPETTAFPEQLYTIYNSCSFTSYKL